MEKKHLIYIAVMLASVLYIKIYPTVKTEPEPTLIISSIEKEDCRLCGDNIFMTYLEQANSIGLLYLNTFDIHELRIRTFTPDGKLSTGFLMSSSHTFADGISSNYCVFPERSYASISISLSSEEKYADFYKLSRFLCQDCLDMVDSLDEPWSEKKPLGLVFVEFETRKIYSLASYRRSFAIGDYMVFLHHDNDDIEAIAIYSPIEKEL